MAASRRKMFIFNSVISIAGSVLAGGFNYVFHFLVSRRLTISQYGELQALLSLVGVLAIFGSTFQNATIRTVAGYAEQGKIGELVSFIKSARKHSYAAAVWLLVVLLIVSPVFIAALHLQSYWELLFVYGAVISGVVASVDSGIVNGLEDFTRSNIESIIASAIKLIAGVALAWYFARTSYVAFSLFLGGLAALLVYRMFANKILPQAADTAAAALPAMPESKWYRLEKAVISEMWPVFIFSFLLVLANNLDVLLVKGVAGSQTVGFYGAFETLGNIILFVNTAIIGVVLPRASGEGYTGKPVSAPFLWLSYGLLIAVALSGFGLYTLFPNAIIGTLYGAKYLVVVSNLKIFALLAAAMSFFILEANVAYARRDSFIIFAEIVVCLGIVTAIFTHHANVRDLVIGVTCAFTAGWIISGIRHILVRIRYT